MQIHTLFVSRAQAKICKHTSVTMVIKLGQDQSNVTVGDVAELLHCSKVNDGESDDLARSVLGCAGCSAVELSKVSCGEAQ